MTAFANNSSSCFSMAADPAWHERLGGLTRRVLEGCRQAQHPVPEVYAAYALCTATDDEKKTFIIEKILSGEANDEETEAALSQLVTAISNKTPQTSCLELQAVHEAALVDAECRLVSATENAKAALLADEV